MITDLLLIFSSFAMGYGIFLVSTYFLVKWVLPKIEDDAETTVDH